MTDKPDEHLTPDDLPEPDAAPEQAADERPVDDAPEPEPVADVAPEPDLADEGDGAVEPGLVVEHDEEIELDDVPDVEPAYELQPGEDTVLHEAALAYDPPEVDDELDEVVAPPADDAPAADDAGDDSTDLQPPGPGDEGGSAHWGRRVLLGLVLVLGVLYVGGYFLTGARMPANATIGGVDVSRQVAVRGPRCRRQGADAQRRPRDRPHARQDRVPHQAQGRRARLRPRPDDQRGRRGAQLEPGRHGRLVLR